VSVAADTAVKTTTDAAAVRPFQPAVAAAGLAVLAFATWLAPDSGWRHAVLMPLGAALGVTLYHAAFGFASAYRRLLVDRDGTGVRAQLAMLAAATALFAPALADGTLFGHPVTGATAPVGIQVAAGAFAFGIGMQLGGGCGSGALYAAGGGSVRMLMTLAAFCAGSFAASLHMHWWTTAPRLPTIVLGEALGWPVAAVLQVIVLLAAAIALRCLTGRPATAPSPARSAIDWRRTWRGPWPMLAGGLMLAFLNWVTLAITGHPWSITWAFTLWGAKVARFLDWDPAGTWFWEGGFTEAALDAPLLADETSVMDIGIVLGALIAAGMAGRFAPVGAIPWRSLLAALAGGLLMGYGARIAYGCNIGAFFSGIASTSLHGWAWIVCAFAGTWIGVRLRPRFGLAN
jgi:uncharacterized membrane protein YedE/YeeE